MTAKISKIRQVENVTNSGRAGHPDLAYLKSSCSNPMVFAFVGKRA